MLIVGFNQSKKWVKSIDLIGYYFSTNKQFSNLFKQIQLMGNWHCSVQKIPEEVRETLKKVPEHRIEIEKVVGSAIKDASTVPTIVKIRFGGIIFI